MDLGYDISKLQQNATTKEAMDGTIDPIDFTSGLGMIFAARPVQYASSNYWLFEHIRRLVENSAQEVVFESIVLGCVNRERDQYAIYIFALGLEHRYLSEIGPLREGKKLWLRGE